MNAVMNAELHQLQGPIQTRGGYSIFRVIERYPEIYHGLELERVRNAVMRGRGGAHRARVLQRLSAGFAPKICRAD